MNDMNILLCSSNEFAIPAYVVIQSIIENNDNFHINFYYASNEKIDEANNIKQFVEKNGHSFSHILVDGSESAKRITETCFPDIVYLKLQAGNFLPNDLDKILYIDIDVLCDASLKDLYEIDLGDKYIAACAGKGNCKKIAALNNGKNMTSKIAANGMYFNSGVILFNLRKLREDFSDKTIDDAYTECVRIANRFLVDQSVINLLCYRNMIFLSPYDWNLRLFNMIDKEVSDDEKRNGKHALIHFCGQLQPFKPWDIMLTDDDLSTIDRMPFEAPYIYIDETTVEWNKKWWNYAEKTPVFNKMYSEMLVKKEWFLRNGIYEINFLTKNIGAIKKTSAAPEPNMRSKITDITQTIPQITQEEIMEKIKKYYDTEKVFDDNKPEMNIMLFSSQEQFDYIYAVMCSVMENNPNVKIHLFIATFVEIKGKEDLIRFIEDRGNRITFYYVEQSLVTCFQKGEIITRTGLSGFLRPITHLIVEEQYDRILFMDADMVVLGDIYSEFYSLDFEDNYLISPANSTDCFESYNQNGKEDLAYEKMVRGSYFSPALILLNLKKMRDDITYDYVLETYNSDKKIVNEQHLINVLYAKKTKYLDPAIYHNRWVFFYAKKNITDEYINKIRLFHFDPVYVPFKPWDIWFEDEKQLDKIKCAPYKSIGNKYRQYILNHDSNRIIGLWWEYCKRTPVYEKLYNRMCEVRTYFTTYIINMINSYNQNAGLIERLYANISTDETEAIANVKKNQQLTYLNAINEYYGLPRYDYSAIEIDYNAVDLNCYFEKIADNNDLVVLITANITAHFIGSRLLVKERLGLKMNCKVNESYLAIIDFAKNQVIEKTGGDIIVQKYSIDVAEKSLVTIKTDELQTEFKCCKTIPVLLKSEGYNPKTLRSYNSILIENIEYAQGIRGINIVVYSKSRNKVIDACHVDNGKLEIKR